MLVTVSTTCPDTMARLAARAFDRARTRGMNHRIVQRYPATQTMSPSAIQPLIVVRSSADPTSEASAKQTTLMNSVATSVIAREVCICFCAMRPAKSSSKKVTACPSVQRCSRIRTIGFTFGATMIAFDAEDRPNMSGLSSRKNAPTPISSARFSAK